MARNVHQSLPLPLTGYTEMTDRAQGSEGGELKACPFCGEKAMLFGDAISDSAEDWQVGCQTFGCMGLWKDGQFFVTQSDAREAWNRRSLSESTAPTPDRISVRRSVLFAAWRAIYEARRLLESSPTESPLGPAADEARRALRRAYVALESPNQAVVERQYGFEPAITERETERAMFQLWEADEARSIDLAEFDHLAAFPEESAPDARRCI